MKLHLPLSLRSALLAACALVGIQNAAAQSATPASTTDNWVLEGLVNEGELETIKDSWTGEDEVISFRGGAHYIEVYNLSSSLEDVPTEGVYLRFNTVDFNNNKIDMRSGVMTGGGTDTLKTFYPPSYGGALSVYIRNLPYNDNDSLYSAPVLFENCKDISMTNNSVWVNSLWGLDDYDEPVRMAEGGAVYVEGSPKGDGTLVTVLEFKNNDKVVFRGNYLTDGKRYELNAISTKNAALSFKTKAGQTVECYDGIHVDIFSDRIDLMINGDELDQDESYTGTVLFSGKYTEEDLGKLNPNYTQEELAASREVYAETMRVYNGVLKLEDGVRVMLESHGGGPTDVPVNFESSTKAVVQMKDATISTLNMVSSYFGFMTYGRVNLPTAEFSGCNTIEATWLNARNGTWTFHVAGVNKDKALLNIEFDTTYRGGGFEFDRQFNTENQTFVIQADANLAKGKYKLLTYNDAAGSWYGKENVTIQGANSTKIGENDVYLLVGDDNVCTLWYDFGNATAEQPGSDTPVTPEEPPARGEAMLTWNSSNGTWSEGAGDWSGSVGDLTFHKNDSVVFDREATVNVSGEVLPKKMTVSNESGVVEFQSLNGGQIAGITSITKTGEGELILGMKNSYTGGTYIKAGIVTIEHAHALGLGDVHMTGGTLNMEGRALANTIYASGEVAIVNGLSFVGDMELDEASLKYSNFTIAKGKKLTMSATTLQEYCNIVLSNGSAMEADTLMLSNGSVLTLEGAEVKGNIIVEDGSLIVTAKQSIGGDLALWGGSVLLSDALDVQGSLTSKSVVDVMLQGQVMKELGATGKADIFTTGNADGFDPDHLSISQLNSSRGYEVRKAGSAVCVELKSVDLTWKSGGSTLKWGVGLDNEWGTDADDKTFHDYDRVIFDNAGTVDIVGSVMPGAIHVMGEQDTIFTCDGLDAPAPAGIKAAMLRNTAGEIVGSGTLTKEDSGTLRIDTDNSYYEGDIIVTGGTLEVGHVNALGSGSAVRIENAAFNGRDHAIVGREISLSGVSSISRANNVKKVRFEGGATVSSDSFKLVGGHTLTIGRGDAVRYVGDEFIFQGGGMLALEGALLDLSAAKSIIFEDNPMGGGVLGDHQADIDDAWNKIPESLKGTLGPLREKLEEVKTMIENQGEGGLGVTVIDLRGREDLVYGGDYDLIKLDLEGVDIADKFVAYFDDLSMALYQELIYEDGMLRLHINMTELDKNIVDSLSRNQRAVYSSLHLMGTLMEAKGVLAEKYKELFRSDVSVAEAKAVLDMLSGQELATVMTSQIEGNMAHLRRLRANMGSGQRLDNEGKTTAYVVGYDDMNRVDADENGPGMKRTEWGGMLGFERCIREESLIGFAITSGSASVSPTYGEKYDADDLRFDFYAVGNMGNGWQGMMSVGFGKHTYATTRHLDAYTAKADIDGFSVNFQSEVSYTKQINETSFVQPFVSFEVTADVVNSFTETGADSASLESKDVATSSADITLGARYIHTFQAAGRTGNVSLQAAIIVRKGDSSSNLDMHFTGVQHRQFTVGAASNDSMGYNLGASLLLPVSNNAAITASANAILRSGAKETGASVGVRISF